MAISIARALNIEEQEKGIVFLLLAQSIFLGIFAGSLDVGANALFLDAYNADMMPRAFMISGAVGIIFTSGYTFLQKRIPFYLFTVINLIVAVAFTGLLRLGYELYDDPRLAFAVLVMMGPIIIISMLGFWGTAGRYFSLREGKRLFGIIDTGSVLGMILAFYAVPVLMNFNFKTIDTLLIGFVSLIVALLFQIIVLRKHKLLAIAPVTGKKREKSGIFSLFKNRYTSLMAVFVMMSVVAGFFIHYSFMWATEENYAESRELTSFLGAFFGTMMIFTVIIKSTLYGWVMKNYGIRVTLLISPVMLLILTVIASGVGGLFGYSAEAASFTLFFLVIALSKLFNKSLKDSIESPSMKILYQSLDTSVRFDVQAKIDGIINEITAFSTGVIMAGLLFLSFIKIIHFSYILTFILIIWVIIGYALYRSYQKTLNDSLARVKSGKKLSSKESEKADSQSVLKTPLASTLIKTDPYFFHEISAQDMNKLLISDNPSTALSAWEYISDTLFVPDEKTFDIALSKAEVSGLKTRIEKIKQRRQLAQSDLSDAFRSGKNDQIVAALHEIVRLNDKQYLPNIIALLRDRDLNIRSLAIEAAGRIKAEEIGAYLVDYLGHNKLYVVAWSALVKMGEGILENLENTFHKTGIEIKVKLRIVRAMDKIGGAKSRSYLFNKIDYHQRDIREAAIEALYRTEFKPDERQKSKLKDIIYEAALAGAVNVASESVLKDHDPGNAIFEAMQEERARTDQLIFRLLGICYDRHAISHVQKSITGEATTDPGYALELLNMIIEDDVFAYLEPYFDDLPVADKIRRLQDEMPVEMLPYEKLLIDIISRDSLYTGNYLRICAIDAIGIHDDIGAGKFLAAQLFHPHPGISGAASVVLGQKNPSLHKNILERLDSDNANNDYQHVFRGQFAAKLTIQQVEHLKKWNLFSSVKREEILKLIQILHVTEKDQVGEQYRVSFLKRNVESDNVLSSGVIIILSEHPEISDHIKYLATLPGLSHYHAELEVARDLFFDSIEIRAHIRDFLISDVARSIFDIKVN